MRTRTGRYYYDDKINQQWVVQIIDLYFTKKTIKKTFSYKDDFYYTKQEAEKHAKNLAKYLSEYRELKIGPLNQDI